MKEAVIVSVPPATAALRMWAVPLPTEFNVATTGSPLNAAPTATVTVSSVPENVTCPPICPENALGFKRIAPSVVPIFTMCPTLMCGLFAGGVIV